MKKQLFHINHERGFYLPIVLVVTTLTLSFITILIYSYQNQLKMTESMMFQVEAETFIQMIRVDFSEMVLVDEPNDTGTVSYEYPNGLVTINYEQESENNWRLNCTIHFANRSSPFESNFTVTVPS